MGRYIDLTGKNLVDCLRSNMRVAKKMAAHYGTFVVNAEMFLRHRPGIWYTGSHVLADVCAVTC